jgi:L-iditol 2-dehydrogenase
LVFGSPKVLQQEFLHSVEVLMAEKMKGIVFLEPGKIELRELPIPTAGPDDVLVRIHAATTCGTDVKIYKRGHPKFLPPMVFGHELAGEIVDVGSRVNKFKIGMRVVPHNSAPCNTCYYCKHAQHNMCDDLLFNWGAYAEYIVVPGPIVSLNMFQLPDDVLYESACIVEPFSTVVHGHRVIQIKHGETVAILGAGGPIGLMHLQMAHYSGASQIIAVDLKEPRLRVAEGLGATRIVNANKENPVEVIKELTDGRGADVVIESAGTKSTWEQSIQVTRKGGRLLWFGGLPSGTVVNVDATMAHYNELTLIGVFHSTPQDVETAYHLICNKVLNTEALISKKMPLEYLEDALNQMNEGTVVKVAIRDN